MAKSKGKTFFRVLGIAFFIILLLAAIPYFHKFHYGFSGNAQDWQTLGSYATAIFGFLAFVGAFFTLYLTIRQSKDTTELAQETSNLARETNKLAQASGEKYIQSEERSIFFKQLELFRDITYKILYPSGNNITGLSAISLFVNHVKSYIMAYYIFADFISDNPEDYIKDLRKKHIDKYDKLNGDNKDEIKKYYSPFEIIMMYVTIIDNSQEPEEIQSDLTTLRTETHIFLQEIASEIYSDLDNYERNFGSRVTDDINSNNYDKIYRAFHYAGYSLMKNFEAELGNYFRNIDYCIQTINEFDSTIPNNDKNKTTYRKILRAQLSRYELAILLCNYLGSESHAETMEAYNSMDIFNDLNLQDLLIKYDLYTDEIKQKESILSSLDIIHRKRLINKTNKSADNLPLYGEFYKDLLPHLYKMID